MAIVVQDFQTLTDDLQEIFNETSRNKVAEMVGKNVFEVMETDRRTFDHLVIHGLGKPQEVTPGADIPKLNSNEGRRIALVKSPLINGENPERTTPNKQGFILSPVQLQRLSEETLFMSEATVRSL